MDQRLSRPTMEREDEGQGLVEYVLVLALVSLLSIVLGTKTGPQVSNIYNKSATRLSTVS